jgi:hypothetical protein
MGRALACFRDALHAAALELSELREASARAALRRGAPP